MWAILTLSPVCHGHERVRILDHIGAGGQDLPADMGPDERGDDETATVVQLEVPHPRPQGRHPRPARRPLR